MFLFLHSQPRLIFSQAGLPNAKRWGVAYPALTQVQDLHHTAIVFRQTCELSVYEVAGLLGWRRKRKQAA